MVRRHKFDKDPLPAVTRGVTGRDTALAWGLGGTVFKGFEGGETERGREREREREGTRPNTWLWREMRSRRGGDQVAKKRG